MNKFYSHLIEIESITVELDQLNLSDSEKNELSGLVDSNIHNAVLDSVFSKLSDEDKRKFAETLNTKDHKKIWEFLNARVENIEDEIKKSAAAVAKELKEDIKEAHKPSFSANKK